MVRGGPQASQLELPELKEATGSILCCWHAKVLSQNLFHILNTYWLKEDLEKLSTSWGQDIPPRVALNVSDLLPFY